jgi:hypothetical protein
MEPAIAQQRVRQVTFLGLMVSLQLPANQMHGQHLLGLVLKVCTTA